MDRHEIAIAQPGTPELMPDSRDDELVAAYERQGSLTAEQAKEFVREALETFGWQVAREVASLRP